MKADIGGEKGRHLRLRLVQKVAEGKPSCELSWRVKVTNKKKEKKSALKSQRCLVVMVNIINKNTFWSSNHPRWSFLTFFQEECISEIHGITLSDAAEARKGT